RSSFSGSVTQLSLMSGCDFSNAGLSFSIVTISGLLTTAIVTCVAAWAAVMLAAPRASPAIRHLILIWFSPRCPDRRVDKKRPGHMSASALYQFVYVAHELSIPLFTFNLIACPKTSCYFRGSKNILKE